MNLNNVSRAKAQEVLEAHGYAIYDSVPTEDLIRCLQDDIESGEIKAEELE